MFAMMTWSCFLFFFYDALDILFFNKMKRERERASPILRGECTYFVVYLFIRQYVYSGGCVRVDVYSLQCYIK